MAEPTCHYCNRPAEEECPACGRLYCGEHGEDLCIRCLSPESAVPSATVFRGSLLALVVATIVALFLWIDPPHTSSSGAAIIATVSAAASPTAPATPSASVSASASAAVSPSPSPTPVPPTATPSPTPVPPTATPTPSFHTYTIVAGDTLETIANAHGTTPAVIRAMNPDLNPYLLPGTVINLP